MLDFVTLDEDSYLCDFFWDIRKDDIDLSMISPLAATALTHGCAGYIIGVKLKEVRGSAHYELIWVIPVNWDYPPRIVSSCLKQRTYAKESATLLLHICGKR